MSEILGQCRFACAVSPSTGKIMKNVLVWLERGQHLPQNKILNFAVRTILRYLGRGRYPAGKFVEKAVWGSVFLTTSHCILNADSTKTHSFTLLFLQICRLGNEHEIDIVSYGLKLSWI